MSDETPSTPSTPETPEAPVPAPPVAESPTEPVEAPAEPTVSAPSEAAVAATPERTGNYVAVPRWLLTAVAVIVGAAVMFGVGYAVGDRVGNDDDRAAVSTPSGNDGSMFPGQGRGDLPMFPGQGQGRDQGNQATPQAPSQGSQGQGSQGQGSTPSQSGAFLGVATQPATGGLEITQVVTNSAAARAGLQVGDVIVSVDGDAVTTPAQLAAAVASLRPGDDVRVAYTRSGANRTVTVELGTRPTTGN